MRAPIYYPMIQPEGLIWPNPAPVAQPAPYAVPQFGGGASAGGGYGSDYAPPAASVGGSGKAPEGAAELVAKLVARGMPLHAAQGVVMNMIDESSLNPDLWGDGGKSYGLSQWYDTRRRNLEAFAAERGQPVSSVDVQLDFLMSELAGPYKGVYDSMVSAEDPRRAAAIFLNRFEIPAETYRRRREAAYLGGAAVPGVADGPTPASDTSGGGSAPVLGMIGGVKPGGGYWQGLESSGRAHAANPDYADYSQHYREFTFEQKPGYVPVGERDGRTVYAAPDVMRDESGNYVPVSSTSYAAEAARRGALIPTRDEVKALYDQAAKVPMPAQNIGETGGAGDPARYTRDVDAATLALNLAPGTPLVHGKEFFLPEGGSAPSSSAAPNPADPGGPERLYQSGGPAAPVYAPEQEVTLWGAFSAGSMNDDQRREYRDGVLGGQIAIPQGSAMAPIYAPEQERTLADLYAAGKMTPEQAADYEFGLKTGAIRAPGTSPAGDGATVQPQEPAPRPRYIDDLPPMPRADMAGSAPSERPRLPGQLDLTRDMARQGGLDAARYFWDKAAEEDTRIGAMKDLGLAGLSALAGLISGAGGAVGDVAEAAGVSRGASERIARDVAAMPEAFAGSPGTLPQRVAPVARAAAREARTAVPAAAATARTGDALMTEIGVLTRRAATGGMGSKKAMERLAEIAALDPEAIAAARRLGINVPADVFTTSTPVRSAAGLTRSVVASEARNEFDDAVRAASTRAGEVMSEVGRARSIDDISDTVQRSITGTRDDLAARASKLYEAVDDVVPPNTAVNPTNVVKALNETIADLGGVDGLSAAERNLYALVTNPHQPVTYARLMREKRLIGRALGGMSEGPYKDADQRLLSRLYAALSEDQLATVEGIGGAALRGDLEIANGLTAQQKALEAQIVATFGKDLEGSIAGRLVTAVSQGANGNDANLNRILRLIPEDLQGEAVMSAVAKAVETTANGERVFGFSQFTKFYSGLRQNPEIYAKVAKAVGPQAAGAMRDLYAVSKRITEARSAIQRTGASNQALVQSMLAEGIVAKVFNHTVGPAVAVAAKATGAVDPITASLAQFAANGAKVSTSRMHVTGALFRNPKFQQMLVEAAQTGSVSASTLRRTWRLPEFRNWARATGIDNPQEWLALTVAGRAAAKEQEQ